MATGFAGGPNSLSVIEETGDRFSDFAPYVAAIDDRGAVVFSARLTEGDSGVYRHDGVTINGSVASDSFRSRTTLARSRSAPNSGTAAPVSSSLRVERSKRWSIHVRASRASAGRS